MVFTEWLLAILYLIGGLNDLFLDLVFYIKPLRRFVAQGRENPRATPEELEGIPEQPIAILIPAWDEAAVIGSMLESTCSRLDYQNYDIFVGTYPNDEPTQMEVARAAFDRPRIHRVVCPNPGPTSKADCLNWVVEAIKLKEQETGKRYAIFTLQDAEDVVHPLTLKVFNRFVPEYDMVQIPVVPFERPLSKLTGNTYLDEFAEVHLKNLDARLAIGGMVPSAGVGTAFGREACDELAAQTNHVLFPPVSLTEDYDFSFRLYRNGRKSGLAKVWVDNLDNPLRPWQELVSIREFFPAVFKDAVTQKQRWMLGITFQGWEKLGWGTGWRERYMLLRDRIGVLTSLLNAVTLLIVLRVSEAILSALAQHHAWNSDLAQFHLPGALTALIDANLALLLFRISQRAVCVKAIARRRQMIMVPLRLLWGNVIDFYCTVHAIRRYVHSRSTGKPLKWLKTTHEFPNVESLLRTHRPLGDLLLERRYISPAQLRDALATQRWRGEKRALGQILVATTAITPEQLADTLTLQARSKVRVQQAAESQAENEPIAARRDQSRITVPLAAANRVTPVANLRPGMEPPPITLDLPTPEPVPVAAMLDVEPAAIAPTAITAAAAPPQPPAPLSIEALAARAQFTWDTPAEVAAPLAPPAAAEGWISPLSDDLRRQISEQVAAHIAHRIQSDPARRRAPEGATAAPASGSLPPETKTSGSSNPRRPAYTVKPIFRPELVQSRPHSPANPKSPVVRTSTTHQFGPAPVIPISRPHRTADRNTRRFAMLHSISSRWKTPFPSNRILVAIGTRPEAIKLAPLVHELQRRAGSPGGPQQVFVCATGQHREMVEEALAGFGIQVDLNLDLMQPEQTLAGVSSLILERFARVIADFQPDWLIVQGDTVTTSMAALAAFYANVRVAHVEAGLRTRDLRQPFPEEFNRRMVGMVASIHFAATGWARQNLLREGVDENDILVTGNTGIDALRWNCQRLGIRMERERPRNTGVVRVLVTAHRRENLDEGIASICFAIKALVDRAPGRYVFLWPLHPNPRVGEIARDILGEERDVLLTGPARYDDLLRYLDQCDIVLTDSGGLQEEAPSFGKPVLILREKTERPEGVRAGMAWLVGTDRTRIEAALEQLADQISEHRTLRSDGNPYGDGFAAQRIADFFANLPVAEFGESAEPEPELRRMPAALAQAARPRIQTVS